MKKIAKIILMLVILFTVELAAFVHGRVNGYKNGYAAGKDSAQSALNKKTQQGFARDDQQRAAIDSLIESFEYRKVESFPDHSEIIKPN